MDDCVYNVEEYIIKPFPPRPAKTHHPFVILLCLIPDDFTRQEKGH